MKHCLNCNQSLSQDSIHCPNCGQKSKISELKFRTLISDFFSNLFNVESKLFVSLRDLVLPGKLTIAFVGGKRQQYYNPIRMFLILLALFFTLFFFSISSFLEEGKESTHALKQAVMDNAMLKKLEQYSDEYELNEEQRQYLLCDLIPNAQPYEDTITFGESATLSMTGGIRTLDFYTLSEEELVEKYEPEAWYETLLLKQIKKMIEDPMSGLRYFIGNGTWIIIFSILLISLLSKLFYTGSIYAEHAILWTIGHSRILLLLCISLLLGRLFGGESINPLFFAFAILFGYFLLFFDLRKYFRESLFKTGWKYCFLMIGYLFIMSGVTLATLAVSFLLL